jgi:hypothetical protein
MSRQKRDSRNVREMVYIHPVHFVLFFFCVLRGVTAPLVRILRTALNWAATNFLHTDHPQRHLALAVFPVALPGLPSSPPPATAGRIAAFGLPVSPRSSLPLVPTPACLSAVL